MATKREMIAMLKKMGYAPGYLNQLTEEELTIIYYDVKQTIGL